MNPKMLWQRRNEKMFVVAPTGTSTWAVAFSRQLIPGALFHTRDAAIHYAFLLAVAAGLTTESIKVLGSA